MRVFVAGATGAVGVPLVRRLIAAGHEVVGLTRTAGKTRLLQRLGATPAVADAMDASALKAAVAGAAPGAVVHVLTALAKTGARRARHLEATNVLRTRGTANLIEAAISGGARRLVAESIILGYGDGGDEVITESRPLAKRAPMHSFQDGLEAIRSLEEQVLEASRSDRIEGIVLRYGLFYGPGAGTDSMLAMLRRRLLPLPGGGHGVASWIHVEDAASATVAALEHGRPGEAYNVVDDEPVSFRDFLMELARVGATPRPRSLPLWMAKLAASHAAAAATMTLRVSNGKAKRDLRWTPAYPSYREGILATIDERRGRHDGPGAG